VNDDFKEAFAFWCDVRGKSGDFGDLVTFVEAWPAIQREQSRAIVVVMSFACSRVARTAFILAPRASVCERDCGVAD
jgi:hypothetical protein